VKGERVGSLGMEEGPCHELLSLPWSLTQVCSLETPSVPSACNTHTHTRVHTQAGDQAVPWLGWSFSKEKGRTEIEFRNPEEQVSQCASFGPGRVGVLSRGTGCLSKGENVLVQSRPRRVAGVWGQIGAKCHHSGLSHGVFTYMR
jgi:hypothetical protein